MNDFYGPEQSELLKKRLEDQGYIDALSEEELKVFNERMKAVDKLFANRPQAKFKIEIQFGSKRSTWKPFCGIISWFLSGTKLNGGGDEKIFICPNDQCKGIIFPNERVGATILCRKCGSMWPETDVIGELAFNLTAQNWAKVLVKQFMHFDNNADLYMKFHRTDIRYTTMMELARKRGGDAINQARRNRGLNIYPLANIIKDTKDGGDIYKRFLSFVNA